MTKPRVVTEAETAEMIRLYTEEHLGGQAIGKLLDRSNSVILGTLKSMGIPLRTRNGGRPGIDAAAHQPHVSYCGLCDKKALYVFTDGPRGGSQAHDGGHILDVAPTSKGRWVDRGDGIYQSRRCPPADGSGRRPHTCRSAR